MQTVLAKIVADKAIWVEARKQQQPLASFQNDVQPSARDFYAERCTHRLYSGVQKSVSVKRRDP